MSSLFSSALLPNRIKKPPPLPTLFHSRATDWATELSSQWHAPGNGLALSLSQPGTALLLPCSWSKLAKQPVLKVGLGISSSSSSSSNPSDPGFEKLPEEDKPLFSSSNPSDPPRHYRDNFDRNSKRQRELYSHLLKDLKAGYIDSTFLTQKDAKNAIVLGLRQSSNFWSLANDSKIHDIDRAFTTYKNGAGSWFSISPVKDESNKLLHWRVSRVGGSAFALAVSPSSAASSSLATPPSAVKSISSSSSSSSTLLEDGDSPRFSLLTPEQKVEKTRELKRKVEELKDELKRKVDDLGSRVAGIQLDKKGDSSSSLKKSGIAPPLSFVGDEGDESFCDAADEDELEADWDSRDGLFAHGNSVPSRILDFSYPYGNGDGLAPLLDTDYDSVPQSNPTPLECQCAFQGGWWEQPVRSYNPSAQFVLAQSGLAAFYSGHLPCVLQKRLESANGYGLALAAYVFAVNAGEGAKKAIDFLVNEIPANFVSAKEGKTAEQIEIDNLNQRKGLAKCIISCMDAKMLCRVTDQSLKDEQFRKELCTAAVETMKRGLQISSAMVDLLDPCFESSADDADDAAAMFATLIESETAPNFPHAGSHEKRSRRM